MKKTGKYIFDVLGWVMTFLAILAFVLAAFSFIKSKQTGEPVTLMGYRPVYVLTGSMEPYMKTDGIVITKAYDGSEPLQEGDVVTYHVEDEEGKTLVITHRIYQMNEDGTIITKGDNNNVPDAYPITAENIEAKAVKPLNWVANLVHLWATTKGKIIICSVMLGVILLYIAVKSIFSGADEEEVVVEITEETKEKTKEEQSTVDEPEGQLPTT